MRLMVEAAGRHARVLRRDNPPSASIQRFGDNGIELELAVWIGDPHLGSGALRSDLYFDIWRAFREHGIKIAYPQREVRLRDGQAAPAPPSPGDSPPR